MSRGAVSRSVSGLADAATVARLRAELRHWLEGIVAIDPQRTCDIVLAVSEALSNCAEHAYRVRPVAGAMTLTLIYHPAHSRVEVVVTDDGQWVVPDGNTTPVEFRGRGLPLLRALSDSCTIDGRQVGTTVRMQFHNCPPRHHQQAASVGGGRNSS